MDRVLIRDIGCHANQEIEIWGWLYNLRSKGKIHFLQIRDGTGRIQAVAVKGECDETSFETIGSLKMEASLTVRGTAREDRRAPSGYELLVQSVHIIQNPDDDYPLAKKAHGIDFLLENRHLWLRSAGPGALLAIRDTIVRTLRGFFKARDFVLIDTPVLTGSIGESASSLFSVDYFDLGNAYSTGAKHNSDPMRAEPLDDSFDVLTYLLVCRQCESVCPTVKSGKRFRDRGKLPRDRPK